MSPRHNAHETIVESAGRFRTCPRQLWHLRRALSPQRFRSMDRTRISHVVTQNQKRPSAIAEGLEG